MRLLQPTRLHPSASLPLRDHGFGFRWRTAAGPCAPGGPGGRVDRRPTLGNGGAIASRRPLSKRFGRIRGKTMGARNARVVKGIERTPSALQATLAGARGRVCGAHGAAGGTRAVQYSAPPDLAEEYRNRVTSPEEVLANPDTHSKTVASIRGQIEGDHADLNEQGTPRAPPPRGARAQLFPARGARARARPRGPGPGGPGPPGAGRRGPPRPGGGGRRFWCGWGLFVAGAGFEPATFRL